MGENLIFDFRIKVRVGFEIVKFILINLKNQEFVKQIVEFHEVGENPIFDFRIKARVGFEPTITGLQPVALATWPSRRNIKNKLVFI